MDYIAHFGIKGMKWGVRRYQNEDGSLTEAGKAKYGTKKNYKAAMKTRADREKAYKNRATLSDAELDTRIARLQKEQRYAELAKRDLHPGQAAVSDTLGKIGKKVAVTAVTGAAVYAGKKAFEYGADKLFSLDTPLPGIARKLDSKGVGAEELKTAANWMFPNPNKKK